MAAKRIHPSLGLPGDVVLYTPQPLFVSDEDKTSSEQDRDRSSDVQREEVVRVRVPGAEIPNIFAHRQWRAGMLLADMIWAHSLPIKEKIVLELGAGTGLPSIASARYGMPSIVVSTDYDSPPLVATLRANILQNVNAKDIVRVAGHTWGQAIEDVEDLLSSPTRAHKVDVILLADCIWDELSHIALLKTATQLLRKSADARMYMVSGLHTGRDKIVSFVRRAHRAGLHIVALPAHVDAHGTPWPALDEHHETIRVAQNVSLASDDALGYSADLIMEMEIATHTDEEQHVLCEGEQQQRIWRSQKPRLTGTRRTFVVQERDEERREMDGVHVRNRWITFLALGWNEAQS